MTDRRSPEEWREERVRRLNEAYDKADEEGGEQGSRIPDYEAAERRITRAIVAEAMDQARAEERERIHGELFLMERLYLADATWVDRDDAMALCVPTTTDDGSST